MSKVTRATRVEPQIMYTGLQGVSDRLETPRRDLLVGRGPKGIRGSNLARRDCWGRGVKMA